MQILLYQKRFGNSGGVNEILSHPWFSDIDQAELLAKKIKPPYVPEVKENLFYFDPLLTAGTNAEETMLPKERQDLIDNNPSYFDKFDTN